MVRGYSSYSGATIVGDCDGGTTPPPPGGESGSKTNIDISRRQWDRTTVTIPAGTASFTVTTSGGSGNADLYLRLGSNPTTKNYDCRSNSANSTESCTITNPGADVAYATIFRSNYRVVTSFCALGNCSLHCPSFHFHVVDT
jgi:hypothetical protein